jgi:hypothetical protein
MASYEQGKAEISLKLRNRAADMGLARKSMLSSGAVPDGRSGSKAVKTTRVLLADNHTAVYSRAWLA